MTKAKDVLDAQQDPALELAPELAPEPPPEEPKEAEVEDALVHAARAAMRRAGLPSALVSVRRIADHPEGGAQLVFSAREHDHARWAASEAISGAGDGREWRYLGGGPDGDPTVPEQRFCAIVTVR